MWLPSGGSLIIDRTEAMTVVDVNTGKFTGSGGNLEETVTKNNLEAAEEIVRQLRLRDIGGIIVVDFIDMVLESNRDLVLRRLVECLGRDRTRHQVAEVTSLGLVQMTRKRIGTGLLEAFSHECEHCKGRGLVVQDHPVEPSAKQDDDEPRGRRSRGGRNRGRGGSGNGGPSGNAGGASAKPSPADLARSRPPEQAADQPDQPDQPDQVAQAEEKPEPAVIGTPSDTPPEPVAVPSTASDDAARVRVPESPSESPSESPQEPSAEPAAPEPPRVVTSTRRRSARRPAGPPAAATEAVGHRESRRRGAGDALGRAGGRARRTRGPGARPRSEPRRARGTTRPHLHAATRRHARPAGDRGGRDRRPRRPRPGRTTEQDDEGDQAGRRRTDDQDDDESDASGGGFSLMHVPIKRKGSRKR